jgi:TetR/AcrR family transcriptional repressor of bet genes
MIGWGYGGQHQDALCFRMTNTMTNERELEMAVSPSPQTSAPGKRAASKARSRKALIDATLDIISEVGIAGTSVSLIVERSKLSRGMIHMHFDNKEHLLLEAARSMADDYYENLFRFIADAPDTPEQRLVAIIEADFDESILNPRAAAIWFAFRGEARSQNVFARYSDTRDSRLKGLYVSTSAQLLGQDSRSREVQDLAHGTIALSEGMWTDYFLHSDAFDRDAAKRVIFRFLSAFLPDYPVFRARVEAGNRVEAGKRGTR